MQILTVQDDNTRLFQELAQAKRRVLVVDYDSVIAPLAAAHSCPPYPNVLDLLDCIMTTGRTRVVWITGGRASAADTPLPGPRADIWRTEAIPPWTFELLESAGGYAATTELKHEIAAMLSTVGDDAAVAFLSDRTRWYAGGQGSGIFKATEDNRTGAERLVQFLVDWLRVCGGEIC
jgi:hypothetical protein